MAERIFLGVDGGGSKTEALAITESGQVIGFGRSGGSNYHGLGIQRALDHVRQAAAQALNGQQATWGAFCLAAADTPTDFAALKPALAELPLCEHVALYNDLRAILRAGSARPYGIAVVCGSGFNAGGLSRDGQEARLPALGEWTGDRAGGCELGSAALGAAFRAWDGRGPATHLQAELLRYFDAPSMETLAERIVQECITRKDVCKLAPLVFRVAAAGDAVAQRLIREQGQEIGVSIVAMARRLGLLDVPCDAVLGGSVFYGEGALLLDTIRETVQPAAPQVTPKRLDVRPVVGATLLAMDHAGAQSDAAWLRALYAGLPAQLILQTEMRSSPERR